MKTFISRMPKLKIFSSLCLAVFVLSLCPIISTDGMLGYNARGGLDDSNRLPWRKTVTVSNDDNVVAIIKLGIVPIDTTFPSPCLFRITELENKGDIFFFEKAPEWQDDSMEDEDAYLCLRGGIVATAHKRFFGIPYTDSETREGINVLLHLAKVESGWKLVGVEDFSINGYFSYQGRLNMELSDD